MFENQSGCVGLHPATRIFLWVSLIIGQSYLLGLSLYVLAIILFVYAFSPKGVFARRIFWRSRFLLVTLLLVYPWSTPGVYIFKSLGGVSPSYEGWHLAAQQLLRTGVVLVGLGWAQGGLAMDKRLESILFWLMPLRYLGLPIERFVIRLALTLQLLEVTPRHTSWSGWRVAWQEVMMSQSSSSSNGEITVEIAPLTRIDYWALVLASCGVVLCVGL